MLDPDYLNQAGDMVGAVYSEIEEEMLSYLCAQLLDQDLKELGQRGLTALALLSQTHATYLAAMISAHQEEINSAIAKTVTDAIERSEAADLAAAGYAAQQAAVQPVQVQLTIQGIAAILQRDNVDMVRGALNLWNNTVAEAVMSVNSGTVTADKAVHAAVRKMMREGVSTITYRNTETGRQTVTNNIDVAARRHVRTQIAQDGMRRTLDICRNAGIDLVEVSSHGGARPSHARWQGRIYSLVGTTEIDGVTYKDFYAETGYGKVDGLGGANCRHSFAPWIPGTPRSYEPNPEHPSGLSGDDIYEMTQEQRRREREIRKTKRELKGAQLIADKDGSLQNYAEVERLKGKLGNQQKRMREYIGECNGKGKAPVLQRSPNREWAGDMPRVRKSDAAKRTIKDFMSSDGVERTLKARGVSKSAARKALTAELQARGVDSRNFAMLSRTNQRSIFKSAIISGAIYDPEGTGRKRATKHAENYYQEIANRNRESTISKIAQASSMSKQDARTAFNHLFINEHDLENGHKKFDPDYYMAQSIQRLIDTRNPEEHDLILFKHEALEAKYMNQGMSQREAHLKANEQYNYQKALKEWIEGREDS